VKVKQIEFQFKGARNYIHGTDMFTTMLSGHTDTVISNIRFAVHDFVYSPVCQLHVTETKEALNDIQDIRARCQFDSNATKCWVALTQANDNNVLGRRYDYDEKQLISLCRIEQNIVSLTQLSPFTFIESIVAMNKQMHQQMFPEAVGKWVFTRIELNVFCNERENLALHFKHNMNYRLTKTDILVDGVKVGDLYFSLVKS